MAAQPAGAATAAGRVPPGGRSGVPTFQATTRCYMKQLTADNVRERLLIPHWVCQVWTDGLGVPPCNDTGPRLLRISGPSGQVWDVELRHASRDGMLLKPNQCSDMLRSLGAQVRSGLLLALEDVQPDPRSFLAMTARVFPVWSSKDPPPVDLPGDPVTASRHRKRNREEDAWESEDSEDEEAGWEAAHDGPSGPGRAKRRGAGARMAQVLAQAESTVLRGPERDDDDEDFQLAEQPTAEAGSAAAQQGPASLAAAGASGAVAAAAAGAAAAAAAAVEPAAAAAVAAAAAAVDVAAAAAAAAVAAAEQEERADEEMKDVLGEEQEEVGAEVGVQEEEEQEEGEEQQPGLAPPLPLPAPQQEPQQQPEMPAGAAADELPAEEDALPEQAAPLAARQKQQRPAGLHQVGAQRAQQAAGEEAAEQGAEALGGAQQAAGEEAAEQGAEALGGEQQAAEEEEEQRDAEQGEGEQQALQAAPRLLAGQSRQPAVHLDQLPPQQRPQLDLRQPPQQQDGQQLLGQLWAATIGVTVMAAMHMHQGLLKQAGKEQVGRRPEQPAARQGGERRLAREPEQRGQGVEQQQQHAAAPAVAATAAAGQAAVPAAAAAAVGGASPAAGGAVGGSEADPFARLAAGPAKAVQERLIHKATSLLLRPPESPGSAADAESALKMVVVAGFGGEPLLGAVLCWQALCAAQREELCDMVLLAAVHGVAASGGLAETLALTGYAGDSAAAEKGAAGGSRASSGTREGSLPTACIPAAAATVLLKCQDRAARVFLEVAQGAERGGGSGSCVAGTGMLAPLRKLLAVQCGGSVLKDILRRWAGLQPHEQHAAFDALLVATAQRDWQHMDRRLQVALSMVPGALRE